jgi:hypothetical protein
MAAQAHGIRGFVDHQVARADLARRRGRRAADCDAQPGVDLAGAGGVQDHVVRAPVGGDGGPAALGDDRQHRHGHLRAVQQPEQPPDLNQVSAGVDQDRVGAGAAVRGGRRRGRGLDVVGQQAQ